MDSSLKVNKEIELCNIADQYGMLQIWKHTIHSKMDGAIRIIYTNSEKITSLDVGFFNINEFAKITSEMVGIGNEMLLPENSENDANWHFNNI
jgi:hypothetical protein